MGCQCGHEYPSEHFLNQFWESLSIRSKPIPDIIDLIRSKKTGTKPITPNKYSLLIQDALQGQEYIEQTQNIFDNALIEARTTYNNEGLLFLSLLFLGTGNENDFIQGFLSLAMVQGNLKKSIEMLPEINEIKIKSDVLKDYIKYYINLISLLGVKHLSTLSENKNLFENNLNKAFSKEHQDRLINENFFQKLKDDETIEINQFFKNHFDLLKNDVLLREKLSTYN